MKKTILTALFAVLAFTACTDKKTEETSQAADTTDVQVPEASDEEKKPVSGVINVTGTILELENGKDGYTAKVKDIDGKHYTVVISRVNFKDPSLYREVSKGQEITVTGEQWEMDGEVHIKAASMAIN